MKIDQTAKTWPDQSLGGLVDIELYFPMIDSLDMRYVGTSVEQFEGLMTDSDRGFW